MPKEKEIFTLMKCQIMCHGYKDYFEDEMRVSFFPLEEKEIFDKTMRLNGHFSKASNLFHSSVDRLFHFLELFDISVDIQEESNYWEMVFAYLDIAGKENVVKLRFYRDYANLFLNGACKEQVDPICRALAKQEERQAKLYETSINS